MTGGALATVVNSTGPWVVHMACVALAAAASSCCLRRSAAAIPLSFLLGSAAAFGLTGASSTRSMYWCECFWEPVFRRGLRSLDGEDAMGLLCAWLLPLAMSLTVLVILRTLRTAAVKPRSRSGG